MPSALFLRQVFLFVLSYGPNLGFSWYSVSALASIPRGILWFHLSSSFYGFYGSIMSGSFGRLGSDLLCCGYRRVVSWFCPWRSHGRASIFRGLAHSSCASFPFGLSGCVSQSCLPYTWVDFLAVITCLVGGSFPTSASRLRGHVRRLVLVP